MTKDDNISQAESILESIGMNSVTKGHAICAVITGAIISAHMMLMYYVDMDGDVVCRDRDACVNMTVPDVDDWCNDTSLQKVWKLDGPTIMTEWEGTCENRWLSAVSRSLFFVGWAVAVGTLGDISDRYGRRKPVFFAIIALSLTSFISACSPSLYFYIGAKFLHGMAVGCALLYVYVYGMELLPPSKGAIFGILYFMIAALGSVFIAVMSWGLHNWRLNTFILSLVTSGLCMWPQRNPESPLWFISKNRIDEGIASFERMSGSQLSHDFVRKQQVSDERSDSSILSSLLALFTPGVPIKLMSFCWFGCALCYIGLAFGGATLPGNAYVNGALSSLAEIPTYPVLHFVLEIRKFSRMKVTVFTLAVGSCCCFSFVVLPLFIAKWVAFVCLMFISAAFTVIYIWSPEVFPFRVRATAMGVCVATGKLGSVVAPFFTWLASGHLVTVMVIYGFITTIATFSALLVPKYCEPASIPSPAAPAASGNTNAQRISITDDDELEEIC
eukprot:TRINITY_DN14814_c0_g1_i1.p1 TRINITY_DN14814_c0_g1~~TRINITY_DN14814_c0_g1_i1.p1  ORF type:complete len:501 (+),score=67.24 TRINITY_DN14814_c0_g1_i1:49-1551(+)